jgi:hypothetical protein
MGSVTNFPFGLSSFGVTLPAQAGFVPMNGRQQWWIQGNLGSDAYDGSSPETPLKTMARAFQLVGSGDVVHFTGNIREQLVAPAGVFDVTIIGEGTRPRHADAHTGNNGYYTATWKPPSAPAAATPLLLVRQQGWRFVNILFQPPTDDAALEFMRDAALGDLERDSSHSGVYGCRFAGGQDGILVSGTEIVHDLLITQNVFNDATGVALKGSAAADYLRRAIITDNVFMNNAKAIICGMYESVVKNNVIGKFTAAANSGGVDLRGGAGGLNVVVNNALSGTYSHAGGYQESAATDSWGGNYNVLAGGVTAALPA